MENYKSWFELQIKNKINTYNRQRTGMAIFIGTSIVILLMLAVIDNSKTFAVCFPILCSAIFMVYSFSFLSSRKTAIGLFFVTTIIISFQLIPTKAYLELLIALTLFNVGTFLISRMTSRRFIQSFTKEIETIYDLKIKSNIDNLTQLLNRNGLEQAIETTWAFCQREQKNISVLLTDIDYFKRFNDILGHVEGDIILKQVAEKMQECFKRKTDIISRIGGEEFIILFPDLRDDDVVEMARFLLSAINSLRIRAIINNNCEFLTVSIGIATGIPREKDSFTDFYKQADKELYHAKKSGRNCISYNDKIIKDCIVCTQGHPVDSVHT